MRKKKIFKYEENTIRQSKEEKEVKIAIMWSLDRAKKRGGRA